MSKENITKNKFNSINGLRVIACLGIILMHIKSNINYEIPGEMLNSVIDEFTNFVFPFMVLSSFCMCCGYYDKVKYNEISPKKFYLKRIMKILPFFMFLLIIDIIVEHNTSAIIEAFANSTLLFGLLQAKMSVLGVAWFIGLVFIYYLMFPFFTFLFSNKKMALIVTIIACLMNLSCVYYFDVGRSNMFYSFVYFCLGGLIYLYKDKIIELFCKSKIIGILFLSLSVIIYFALPQKNGCIFLIKQILLCSSLIIYCISYESKILDNGVSEFIGNISLELYLCHMVIYRIVEKMQLSHIFKTNTASYISVVIMVVLGSIIFSTVFKKIWNKIERRIYKDENIIG